MASYVGKTAVVSGTTGTTRTIDLSTTSGWTPYKYDLVIVHVALSYAGASSATISMGSGEGWTLMPSGSQSTGSAYLFANYYKIWGLTGNTDNLSTTVTVSGASKWSIIAEVFRSPSGRWDPTTPIEASNFSIVNSSPTTTMTCPAVTSGGTGRTGIGIAWSCDNNSNGGTSTNSWTKAISAGDVNVNSGSGYSLCTLYKDSIGSGSVATSTVTQTANGADNYVVWTYLLVQGAAPPEVYTSLIVPGTWLQCPYPADAPGTTRFHGGETQTVLMKIPALSAGADRGICRPLSFDQEANFSGYPQLEVNLQIKFDHVDSSTVTVSLILEILQDDTPPGILQTLTTFVTDYATAQDWIGLSMNCVPSSTQDVISVCYMLNDGVMVGPFTYTILFSALTSLASNVLLDINDVSIRMDGAGANAGESYYNGKVVVETSAPSNATIKTRLTTLTALTGATCDWELRNVAGTTSLLDRSGNGNTIVISGVNSPPTQGLLAPTFSSPTPAGRGFFLLMVR